MKLPDPWGAYLRLQSDLKHTTQVNNRSWGLEAGLDAILAAESSDGSLPAPDLPTTIATAERRDRHRARLRRTYAPALWPAVDQPAAVEARVELAQVRQLVDVADWQLITNVAMGMDYRTISKDLGATSSSLRIRVMRIRDDLRVAA